MNEASARAAINRLVQYQVSVVTVPVVVDSYSSVYGTFG